MMKIMKKGLRQVQLVTVSVVLSILTVFFSCNGWGGGVGWGAGVVPVSYWITIVFDPKTGNFIHPHIKTIRDDTKEDVTSYYTGAKKQIHNQTTIKVHNTPLARGTYPIEIETPRDAVTLINKTAGDFCEGYGCGYQSNYHYLGLMRSYSQFIFTLQNQHSSDQVQVKSSLIRSTVGNGFGGGQRNAMFYNGDHNENCLRVSSNDQLPHEITNLPEKNCTAYLHRLEIGNSEPYINGYMHFVFDYDNKLKDFFKNPTTAGGTYEGKVKYTGDSVPTDGPRMYEKYTFHFKIRKLTPNSNLVYDDNTNQINLIWHTIRQGDHFYKVYVSGRKFFSVDGHWIPSQALLLHLGRSNTPMYCPFLPLDLKIIKEKILGIAVKPEDVSCDSYMPYEVHLTDLQSFMRRSWMDGQTLKIKPVQLNHFWGGIDVNFEVNSSFKPRYPSGSFLIPLTIKVELSYAPA